MLEVVSLELRRLVLESMIRTIRRPSVLMLLEVVSLELRRLPRHRILVTGACLRNLSLIFSKNLAECSDATAGVGFGRLSQIDFPSLSASGCVASACARLPAAAPASPLAPASRVSSSAVFAVVAHARSTPMHDARNSCSDTGMNSLRDQRCRKVLQSCTVGNRYAEQTVDMSPAPDAGTYRRSAGTVHAQRQVPRKRLARSSGVRGGPVVGLVVVEESQASLRPPWRFLAHW